MIGLIPLISAMVHQCPPYSLKTDRRISSLLLVSLAAMIIGSISLAPKWAYLRCSGKGSSSNLGGSSIDRHNWDLGSTLNGSGQGSYRVMTHG